MRMSGWSSDVCSSDLRAHRLKAEIIATKTANRMINRSGIILPFALAEEEGCGLGHVASAYATAEALFDLSALWRDIEDAAVEPTTDLAMLAATAAALRLHVADLVRTMPPQAGQIGRSSCQDLVCVYV